MDGRMVKHLGLKCRKFYSGQHILYDLKTITTFYDKKMIFNATSVKEIHEH